MAAEGLPSEHGIRATPNPLAVVAGLLTAGLLGTSPILLTMLATAFVSVPVIFGYATLLVLPTGFVVAMPAYFLAASRSPATWVRALAVSAACLTVFAAALLADLALPTFLHFPLPLGLMVATSTTLFGGALTIAFEGSRRVAAIASGALSVVAIVGWVLMFVWQPAV